MLFNDLYIKTMSGKSIVLEVNTKIYVQGDKSVYNLLSIISVLDKCKSYQA